jgi:D-galactarolactone cycloisomerase
MCDANQAFTRDSAIDFARAAGRLNLQWLEQPIRVDAPREDWQALADGSPIPLDGGENLQDKQFDEAIADRVLRVLQPDITKWEGLLEDASEGRLYRD